jgi:2-alkyl-3-oxoalkanoate reductase
MEALAARTTPRPTVHTISWGTLNRAARSARWMNRTVFRGRAPMPGILTPASLHARCKPLLYPNDRAKKLLGWKPRVGMGEALQRIT